MIPKIDSIDAPASTGSGADLQVVAKVCSAGGCPTIYRTPTGDLLVQGYTTDGAGVDLPDGEGLVRIPPALLADLLRAMS
jgi:hypothetical protein